MEPSSVEEAVRALPIWAQVALAARCVRRAALGATTFLAATQVQVLLAGCDALDRSAAGADVAAADRPLLSRAASLQPPVRGGELLAAMHSAVDAAHGAVASSEIAAAETACLNSVCRAIARAATSLEQPDTEARALAHRDAAALADACARAGVGRYDALGATLFASLPGSTPR